MGGHARLPVAVVDGRSRMKGCAARLGRPAPPKRQPCTFKYDPDDFGEAGRNLKYTSKAPNAPPGIRHSSGTATIVLSEAPVLARRACSALREELRSCKTGSWITVQSYNPELSWKGVTRSLRCWELARSPLPI